MQGKFFNNEYLFAEPNEQKTKATISVAFINLFK